MAVRLLSYYGRDHGVHVCWPIIVHEW